MIPMFKAKEEEAQQQYEKILKVKQQMNELKDQLGIIPIKYAQPLAKTSFMVSRKPATLCKSISGV